VDFLPQGFQRARYCVQDVSFILNVFLPSETRIKSALKTIALVRGTAARVFTYECAPRQHGALATVQSSHAIT